MASMAAAGLASTTTADPASATTADPASTTAADPASTTAADLDDFFTVNDADAVCIRAPTQSKMRQFAAAFPGIKTLYMDLEYGNGGEGLDFSDIVLPSLVSLRLTCVYVPVLKLTSDNTPKLESITLSNLTEEVNVSTLIFPSSNTFPLSTRTSTLPGTHSACR